MWKLTEKRVSARALEGGDGAVVEDEHCSVLGQSSTGQARSLLVAAQPQKSLTATH